MGSHKLDMVKKSSKKKKITKKKKPTKKKITKKKKQTTKKSKIVDVPLSNKLSEGSKATLGNIDYHYQKYYNTFAFINEIILRNKKLNKQICIPNVGNGWMKSFLKTEFLKTNHHGDLILTTITVQEILTSHQTSMKL